MRYTTLLFDLDGTLTDPREGITKSIAYALEKRGDVVEDLDTLLHFIGPPLIPAFMETYGVTKPEAEQMLRDYRERFGTVGWAENAVYDGVREALEELMATGVCMCLATSKPEVYAERIMEHFDLARYMDFMGGSDMEETRSDKESVIRYVLEKIGAEDLSSVVMIGDRMHDTEGAAKVGIDCIGVLWGYGSEEELRSHGATHIARDLAEMISIIKGE